MFSHIESPARNNTGDTSEVSTGVSMATTGPDTPTVKKEKTDSPSPPTDVTPVHHPWPSTFPSMARLGYLSQNQAYVTAGTTRRRVSARPQCSICLKRFSRSGTLKVILASVANTKLQDQSSQQDEGANQVNLIVEVTRNRSQRNTSLYGVAATVPCMFSHTWYGLHVFPRLASVA